MKLGKLLITFIILFSSMLNASNDISSKIGLNYTEITSGDKQLARMLSDGEREFFSNIDKVVEFKGGKKRYQSEKRQKSIWTEIVKTIGKGQMNKRQLQMLEIGNPKMLLEFIKLDGTNFKLLNEIGKLEEEKGKLEEEKGKTRKLKELFGR